MLTNLRLNMLFDQRDKLYESIDDDSSALNTWMRINGKDTIEKWKEFEKNGLNQCLTFSGLSFLIKKHLYNRESCSRMFNI